MILPSRLSFKRVIPTLALLCVAAVAVTGLSAPVAHADPVALNLVGTSDVLDSNLVTAVLKPGFEAAYRRRFAFLMEGRGLVIELAHETPKNPKMTSDMRPMLGRAPPRG